METPEFDDPIEDTAPATAPDDGDAGAVPPADPEEQAEEPSAPDDAEAWQLTLPQVDDAESAEGVPLSEVAAENAGADADAAAQAEEEGPGPSDEHLFEVPAETGEIGQIAASVADEPVAEDVPVSGARVPWWPFLAYGGVWLIFAVALVVVSNRLGDPYLPESGAYAPFLLAGLILAVAGPFMGVAGWYLARRGLAEGERSGLLSSAMVKAGAFTLGGIVLWWAALILQDALRLGWI